MNPILALDFGRARIGVAISDELHLLAHPLETISANQQPAARVAEIVRDKNVDHVVAGIPKRMDGQIGSAATEVLQFVEKLRLEEAKARLVIPRSTVQNVAESVGFKNRFVFSRAFERRFGLRPNAYRQRFQPSVKPV